MKVVVCIKEVPKSDEIKIDKKTKNVDRRGAEMIINPYDMNAVQLAIRLKELHGAETFVLTMGLPSAEQSLRECLAMGIDRALLITDRKMAGSDTIATSLVLATAIKKYVPEFDLVLCGKHAIDAETSIVGPGIAERLGIAQLTYVDEWVGIRDDNKVVVRKNSDEGEMLLEASLPAMISVTAEINKPEYMNLNRIGYAMNADVEMITTEKLGLMENLVGVSGSPTVVGEMHMVDKAAGSCKILSGEPAELAKQIAEIAKTVKSMCHA